MIQPDGKDRDKIIKKAMADFEKDDTVIEPFEIKVNITGKDAVMLRLMVELCDSGKEQEMLKAVVMRGVMEASQSLLAMMLKHTPKSETPHNKYPFIQKMTW